MATIQWTREDAEGFEETITFPAVNEVCPRCGGEGTHDHQAFSNGISGEVWEYEWDQDDRDNYLSGRYDVLCTTCEGKRVVPVIDEDRCTGELAEHLKAYNDYLEEEYSYRRMCEAERRMGA